MAPPGRVTARSRRLGGRHPKWKAPAKAIGRIGMVGWSTATGLGYLNRDIAVHLPLAKWLMPDHPYTPTLPVPKCDFRCSRFPWAIELGASRGRGFWDSIGSSSPSALIPQIVHSEPVGWASTCACVPMWELTDLRPAGCIS